ncbi:Ribokinase-like protein [Ramicandelaber brevisporus]|nr:Ribokinase-like protein [Ramicandelaber brevisporus]
MAAAAATATARVVSVYGSINIDEVYEVPKLAVAGQTVHALRRSIIAGGKGANQAVAAARARSSLAASADSPVGATAAAAGVVAAAATRVRMAGAVGNDGTWILDELAASNVDISNVRVLGSIDTGRAVIQVERDDGDNGIILFSGANYAITQAVIAEQKLHSPLAADLFCRGGLMLLQNEISCTAEIAAAAKQAGMAVVWNAAPVDCFTADVRAEYRAVLDHTDILVVNQSELVELHSVLVAAKTSAPGKASASDTLELAVELQKAHPSLKCVVRTMGPQGVHVVHFFGGSSGCEPQLVHVAAAPVKHVVDTTAAGDTWVGYFAAAIADELEQKAAPSAGEVDDAAAADVAGGIEQDMAEVFRSPALTHALRRACAASAITISKRGAIPSIPWVDQVLNSMQEHR